MSMPRYSTVDVPTIARFQKSDAFIRGLMGPVGGGKSSGVVWDIIRRGLRQKPGPDGVRRTKWAVVRNCFDDQTEILTEKRGWQLIRDLLPDDKVATLHDGERLVFDLPTAYYTAPYEGEMLGICNEGIDLLVTPEHRLWVTKTSGRARRETPFRHVEASACYGMIDWRMKRDATFDGGQDRYPTAFYEFLGFWFAEGYAGAYDYADRAEPHWRFVLSQKTHCGYTRLLLRDAGLKWGESVTENGCVNFRISITESLKPLVKELASLGRAGEKYLPLWIKESTPAALRAFLRGYIMGDGLIRRCPHETTYARTTSRQLADDIQEIALRVGEVVNITVELPRATNPFGSTATTYRMAFVQPKKRQPKTGHSWYRQHYSGSVWCVEVPTHVVYVRRNGRAVWCGQSYRMLADTTIATWQQWFPPHQFGEWRASEDKYIIKALRARDDEPGAEIELLFRALDRPDQVGNLLSLELTGGWVNEAREVPWTIIEALTGRVGRFPAIRDGGPTWLGIMLDTNPPDVESDWYKFFEEQDHTEAVAALRDIIPGMTVEKFSAIFKQPDGLGPNAENLKNLPKGYYQRLAVGKDKPWVDVYIRGQYGFTQDGKPVFPEYNDELHCGECWTIDDAPVQRGWDFGLTPACVFSQMLPSGQWIIVDELCATKSGIDRFSDEVLDHSARHFKGAVFEDTGDPAGAQKAQTDERTCFQILHAKGIHIEPGLQTPTLRLESVRRPLTTLIGRGVPAFRLHPRCKTLRRGFLGGYQWRRKRVAGEQYDDKPDKNRFSHPMDAAQYTATRLFGTELRMPPPGGDRYDDDDFADQSRSSVTGY